MAIKTLKDLASQVVDYRITESSKGFPLWKGEPWPGEMLNPVKVINADYQAKVKDNLQVIFPTHTANINITLPANPENGDMVQIFDAEQVCSDTVTIKVDGNGKGIGDGATGDADTVLLTISGIRIVFIYNSNINSWDFVFNRSYQESSYQFATVEDLKTSIVAALTFTLDLSRHNKLMLSGLINPSADFSVDWGDGTIAGAADFTDGAISHNYPSPSGSVLVVVSGKADAIKAELE